MRALYAKPWTQLRIFESGLLLGLTLGCAGARFFTLGATLANGVCRWCDMVLPAMDERSTVTEPSLSFLVQCACSTSLMHPYVYQREKDSRPLRGLFIEGRLKEWLSRGHEARNPTLRCAYAQLVSPSKYVGYGSCSVQLIL